MNETQTTAQIKIAVFFAKLSIKQLIEAFEATDSRNEPEIPAARGWMMDEMERRNPQAFEAWLENCATIPPRKYFL